MNDKFRETYSSPQTITNERRGIQMKKDLKEITKEWMQLERKTLEQRKQADEFYENKLMALI